MADPYMSSRGVDFVSVALDEEGCPTFAFQCDCGELTRVAVEALAEHAGTDALEFAFTCDGCQSSHWVTISRQPETLENADA
jgi:hypothetical protein